MNTNLNTIQAKEIKRRGISAVDEQLENGPVHVIKNNQPKYVILDEDNYQKLVTEQDQSYETFLLKSLKEVKAGKVRTYKSVEEVMDAIEGSDD